MLVEVLERQGGTAANVAADESPLARARLQRRLTVDEAARRARLSEDEIHWLEEGRPYRFRSPDQALLAAIVYATALGIDQREALGLAGRPVPPLPLRRNHRRRIGVLAAVLVVAAGASATVLLADRHEQQARKVAAQQAALPPPWAIDVVVLNGSGDINYTRRVASRVGALGYEIAHVGRAGRFDYPQTSVFFPPGGESVALRLAKQLGVATQPLPGGTDPKRLVVIVGPPQGPDG
jgi:transcriptional regulator with XRE-family HTH domain